MALIAHYEKKKQKKFGPRNNVSSVCVCVSQHLIELLREYSFIISLRAK